MASAREQLEAMLLGGGGGGASFAQPALARSTPSARAALDSMFAPPVEEAAPTIPGIGGNVVALRDWITKNPQTVADILIQGGFTAGGIAAGAMTGPAAPITMPTLGAAGSVVGREVSHDIGRRLGFPDAVQREPTTGEDIIDAGAGALGPVAGTLARSTARGLTGLRQGTFRRSADEFRAGVTNPAPEIREATEGFAREFATQDAIKEATGAGATIRRGVAGAGAGAFSLVTGEPITSALLGAGISEAVLSRAGPAILNSRFGDRFAKWALNLHNGNARTREAIASFGAIFAGKDLDADTRKAVDAFRADMTSPPEGTGRRTQGPDTRRVALAASMNRDERGRFTGLIQDLMGEGEDSG